MEEEAKHTILIIFYIGYYILMNIFLFITFDIETYT